MPTLPRGLLDGHTRGVHALCGVKFVARALPLGGPAPSGEPLRMVGVSSLDSFVHLPDHPRVRAPTALFSETGVGVNRQLPCSTVTVRNHQERTMPACEGATRGNFARKLPLVAPSQSSYGPPGGTGGSNVAGGTRPYHSAKDRRS